MCGLHETLAIGNLYKYYVNNCVWHFYIYTNLKDFWTVAQHTMCTCGAVEVKKSFVYGVTKAALEYC